MPPPSDLRARMRQFYATSETYKGLLDAHRETYLLPYVNLVRRFVSPPGRLLELGGGNGVASRMFHEVGFRVLGTDISPLFLKEAADWQTDGLSYVVADGLELPFPDGSFQVVCSNEYLEHVPDAESALSEMARVVAPGGRLLILGPNLLSPFLPLMDFLKILTGRSDAAVWTTTWRGAVYQTVNNARILAEKQRARTPRFLYREPDLRDRIIGGDADSSYLANPVDIENYFRSKGWKIVAVAAGSGWKGKLVARWMPRYAPYLCVVVEKPS